MCVHAAYGRLLVLLLLLFAATSSDSRAQASSDLSRGIWVAANGDGMAFCLSGDMVFWGNPQLTLLFGTWESVDNERVKVIHCLSCAVPQHRTLETCSYKIQGDTLRLFACSFNATMSRRAGPPRDTLGRGCRVN